MKTRTFLITAIAVITLFPSCRKEGCTDDNATNFNADAKKDDGTCKYDSDVVFWTQNLTGGAIDLTVNNQFIGNIGVTFSGSPSCGATGALTKHFDLGTNKSITIQVHAENTLYIWDYSLTLNANTCHNSEL